MDDEDKLAAVISAADLLQEFYDTNHNLQNDMPGPKPDRESDDGGRLNQPMASRCRKPEDRLSRCAEATAESASIGLAAAAVRAK